MLNASTGKRQAGIICVHSGFRIDDKSETVFDYLNKKQTIDDWFNKSHDIAISVTKCRDLLYQMPF